MNKRQRKKLLPSKGGHFIIRKNGRVYPIRIYNGDRMIEPALFRWGKAFEKTRSRIVGHNQVTPDILVSTVFLGLDHSFVGGPPVLFETMIFGGKHDGKQWRYRTLKQARKGHEHAVLTVIFKGDNHERELSA